MSRVHYSNWELTKYHVDHLDIFHMYAKIGNNECTDIQLKFQISQNPLVFVTTPKVGGTGLSLTAANYAVITEKFWVLNK